MNIVRLLFIILLFSFFISCGTESTPEDTPDIIKKEQISGYVQKGPFVSGTSILMNELNSELSQTGNIFTSSIINDSGLFELNNIELNSSFVEFTSNGFYFNEVSGELSVSQLTLSSLSDIEDKSSINVNVLTHLEKKRVETLIGEGLSFSESKTQSRNELLSVFSMSLDNDSSFEEFDISQNTEEGGILLGVSIILQGNRSVGELTELLSRLQNDFSDNGSIDNEDLLNTLRTTTSKLDFNQIRENVKTRLSELNIESTVPNFEKHLISFLSGTDFPLTVTTEGEGTVEERIISQPKTTDYPYGTVVELTPVPTEGWEFIGWSGDINSTEEVIEVTIDGETNITGTFQRKNYPLTVTTEGDGIVEEQIISQPKTTDYSYGTVVELTPFPMEGWEFVGWSGDTTSTQEILQITVNGETNITGTFQRKDYQLNITVVGNGTVEERIVSQPKTTNYSYETIVELTPVPENGSVFDRWEGDLTGSETPVEITVDGDKNVTVYFRQPVYKLGDNGVTVVCENVKPGEKGTINGDEYEVVDNTLLRTRRDEGVDMTKLCTSLVTDMTEMFSGRPFNQPINNWDVSSVESMNRMFFESTFNQSIENWDVSSVTNMGFMFFNSYFNQLVENWDVSNVTDMSFMFEGSQFNQPIGNWNVSSVENMYGMFSGSQFNQPIGNWDVSNVTEIGEMFSRTQFNQPIENWDLSSVQNMYGMFIESTFNQPIGNWNVSNVTEMSLMFYDSQFNKDISKWCVTDIPYEPNSFSDGSPLLEEYKPIWGTCPSN